MSADQEATTPAHLKVSDEMRRAGAKALTDAMGEPFLPWDVAEAVFRAMIAVHPAMLYPIITVHPDSSGEWQAKP